MTDKQQIIKRLSKRKLRNVVNATTWADIKSALNLQKKSEKDAFIELVLAGQEKKLGLMVINAVKMKARKEAEASVTESLTDNSLSLAEIDDLL